MSLKNVKNIVKAFTSEEPTQEEWYKKRMEICGSCEYNSANKDNSELTSAEKIKLSTVCSGDSVCTACGCCVSRKARVKESVCGMVELGLEPKWGSIIAASPLDKNMVVNSQDSEVSVATDGNRVIVTRSYSKTQPKIKFLLNFLHLNTDVEMMSASAGCSCTASLHDKVSDRSFNLAVEVSTVGFKGEVVEKGLTVNYKYPNNKTNLVRVTLRFKKV